MVEDKNVKRVKVDGEVYISLEDMKYLCEVSRDRHAVYGHPLAASAMENFSVSLGMMLMIE
jgi:hypothetical protein